MNDAEAQRLLAGIDAPRPMPSSLRDELLGTLTTARELAVADAPRPLPDDLRHRLEATLITAGARPMPRWLRRRVLASTARPAPRLLGAVAAALLLVVAGVAVATRNSGSPDTVAGPRTERGTTTAPATTETGVGEVQSGASSFDSGAGSTATGSDAAGDAAAPAAAPAAEARTSARATIGISVFANGPVDEAIRNGFDAYLAMVNASGGLGGRRLVPLSPTEPSADEGRPYIPSGPSPDGVAAVNLGTHYADDENYGDFFEGRLVFEPIGYRWKKLTGLHVALSSPVERVSDLTVEAGTRELSPGARVAVYSTVTRGYQETAWWAGESGDRMESALLARGYTVVPVEFDPDRPTYVPGVDAALLALAPVALEAWLDGAVPTTVAAPHGVWAIGDGFDDRYADKAGDLGVRVLSPYQPIGGDEGDALRRALPGRQLNQRAVHGWVTAKALVHLLRLNGGNRLGKADLERLRGWDSGWAPAYATRDGFNDRTPEAILLRPKDGRFVPDGSFRRAAN
jgi:hypothetical protein